MCSHFFTKRTNLLAKHMMYLVITIDLYFNEVYMKCYLFNNYICLFNNYNYFTTTHYRNC